ncbi:MAG: sulfur carrier protein ThiS adenylyltransferase ThiF [Candidatus Thermoplasmatota archaeon]
MVKKDKKQKNRVLKQKLKQISVGIAGLGGLGSNVAVALAREGIGKLVLVDFDKIEKSNLNRQYYFLDQIGKLKTEVLKENIQRINPNVELQVFNQKLEKGSMETLFKDVDIVVEALDKAEIKTDFIEEIMLKLPGKPLVAASGVAGVGKSDRIHTKKTGNLYMVYDEHAESSEEDLLIGARVGLIANWQANIVLELIMEEKV